MAKQCPSHLAIAMLLLFIINKSSSARTLGNPTPNHNHSHHRITFLMQHILNNATHEPSNKPTTTKVTGHQIPFSKPLGIFPPKKGIPIPQSSTETLDLSSIGFSFPARASLQELQLGLVTSIDDEELLEGEGEGDEIKKVGKAQGVYVASSEDGSSYMVAMTASFVKGGEYEDDGVRFFGVYRSEVFESHVAVIGGTGKYYGANGYAVVKVVDRVGSSSTVEGKVASSKLLLFDVYFIS